MTIVPIISPRSGASDGCAGAETALPALDEGGAARLAESLLAVEGAAEGVVYAEVKRHAPGTEERVKAGCTMCQNTKKRAGFTIVELMIVLVIIGVAAAIAVPMISSAGSMQIRAAANMVAADLEYAKSMAISRGQQYVVVFDTANETYEILDSAGNAVPHPITKKSEYVVDFANDSRLSGVDIVTVALNPGGVGIGFDYLGSPYSGAPGSLADLNSGVVTLQAGNSTRTVSVEAVTGFISVSN